MEIDTCTCSDEEVRKESQATHNMNCVHGLRGYCTKAKEGRFMYRCNSCDDYMLCEEDFKDYRKCVKRSPEKEEEQQSISSLSSQSAWKVRIKTTDVTTGTVLENIPVERAHRFSHDFAAVCTVCKKQHHIIVGYKGVTYTKRTSYEIGNVRPYKYEQISESRDPKDMQKTLSDNFKYESASIPRVQKDNKKEEASSSSASSSSLLSMGLLCPLKLTSQPKLSSNVLFHVHEVASIPRQRERNEENKTLASLSTESLKGDKETTEANVISQQEDTRKRSVDVTLKSTTSVDVSMPLMTLPFVARQD